MSALRILFAGTPAFTLPALDALFQSEHQLIAVYTQPDRPAGRGRQLQASAVKTWALEKALPIFQPENLKSPESQAELASLKPDLMVVIAYGLILPKAVLAIPALGCVNVHASLLPHLRGAAPIQEAIRLGDSETGVTIMQMDPGMDTGPMLKQARCPILNTDTAASLHDRLAKLAVAPLLECIQALANGQAKPLEQDHAQASYAKKISKEQAKIDWQLAAKSIDCQIRAFNPWPIAYTELGETVLRIHQAKPLDTTTQARPGEVIQVSKSGIQIATGAGILEVTSLQLPGGKVLSVSDWFNAKKDQIPLGTVLQ